MKERDGGERKERGEMEKEMKGRDGERERRRGGKEKQGTEKGEREREKKESSIISCIDHHLCQAPCVRGRQKFNIG